MKKLTVLLLIFVLSGISYSQFKDYRVKGGVQYNVISPSGELKANLSSFFGRGYLAIELGKYFDVELGGGFMKWKQKDQINGGDKELEVDLIPIDVRLRIEPFAPKMKHVNPYMYIGGGIVNHKLKKQPEYTTYTARYDSTELDGWVGYFPAGIGLEIKLSKQVLLDLSVGAATTLSDKINNLIVGSPKDGWFNYGLGITVTGKGGKTDSDRDGLYDEDEEDVYGTDPENPDTDGDGLIDGAEVTSYMTNPLLQDTDGDGLGDGQEVNDFKTDPLKTDTDGDTLGDGDEVVKYKTNPLKADTDNGSVDDGTEVRRGSDPLNPADDVVKEEMEVGQVIILEGINFETNSARITADSEEKLMKAYNTLVNNPKIDVEISGHTDSRGSNSKNQVLSEQRANSVKDWLVAKGIDGARITTVGYGEDKPIAPNDSEENMLKNRRIEFKRTK